MVDYPSVDLLTLFITSKTRPLHSHDDESLNEKLEELEYFPLSLNQEQIWNLWSLYPQNLTHNISTCIEINKELDIEIINQVINRIFTNHDVFRTKFLTKNSEVYQFIENFKEIKIEFIETNMEEVVFLNYK